ncbi:hypothetical protein DUE52_27590 [Larkinella punicea]|uniref:DUF4384 domain-containing protein n=1 Tax=Larkinella punicea TaxID=2315727 RepID=A0A368JHZ4_9BACT|nr:hypothetical protein DUE52_27590 [Larkinella punicea]
MSGWRAGSVAQTSTSDYGTILAQLRQTDVFRECAEFKSSVERDTRNAAQSPNLTAEQREQLRLAYTGVYEKHDAFLKTVKQDLVNTQRMQAVAANPAAEAAQYATLYAAVKTEYDNRLVPVLQSIPGSGKAILDDLKAMAKATFSTVVSQVLTNVTTRIQQKLTLNAVLPVVNEQFYNPLRLKLWSELDIPAPATSIGNPALSGPTTTGNPALAAGSGTLVQPQSEAVVIPAPTVSQLSGTLMFVQTTNSTELPMNFELRTGKDIDVVTDVPNDHSTVPDLYFTTSEAYPLGTRFKIKVTNSAFTYVLVLNSDGVKLLHPRVQINSGNGGKDIDVVGDVTPATGDLQIPSTGSFAITPSKTGVQTESEDFALLLSKSELSVEEIIEKLNAIPGNLAERITQIFGGERVSLSQAGVQSMGNQLTFNAGGATQHVLPLVFKIRKM